MLMIFFFGLLPRGVHSRDFAPVGRTPPLELSVQCAEAGGVALGDNTKIMGATMSLAQLLHHGGCVTQAVGSAEVCWAGVDDLNEAKTRVSQRAPQELPEHRRMGGRRPGHEARPARRGQLAQVEGTLDVSEARG